MLPFNRSARHREAFDVRRCPGVPFPHRYQTTFRSANNSSSQLNRNTTSLFPICSLITIFTTLSPLFAYRPPTTQPAPTMSPRTRLTTLFRALCARLHRYTRRSPTPAPIPEERTQITYAPIEYSHTSSDSTGSDDIPWAEHVRDGSNNAVRRGEAKWE